MIRVVVWTVFAGTLLASTETSACDKCRANGGLHCQICGCQCCPCENCQRTVMVPMCVTETRMQVKIVETKKEREESYTVFKRVPEKRTFTKECCYLETEIKSKEITVEECHRVRNPVILEDKVALPVTEIHEGVRRREVCTLCGKVCIEEPCTCRLTRTEESPRVQNCDREDIVFEQCKKTIDYCVTTPKVEKKECGVETVYKLVPVTKTCKVQVCVPETVRVPVEVKVNKMVAQQICCCEECWCEMQQHQRREKKHAEHKDKACKTCVALAQPATYGNAALAAVDVGQNAVVETPKRVARWVSEGVGVLHPLR